MIGVILRLPAAALSFALFFSPFTTAAAAAPDPDFMLDLGGQRFDPLFDPPQGTIGRDAGVQLRLVQFSGPIQPDWLDALDHAGAEVLQYIHPYSYVVWADAQQVSRAAQSVPLRWSGAYTAGFALSQASRGLDAQPYPVMVMAARKADAGARQSGLHALGAKIERVTRLDQHFDLLHLEIAGDRLAELAALPGMFAVQRIQPITAEEAKRGEKSQLSVVGAHGPAPDYKLVPGYFDWLAESGYDGDGVVVGIVDGGVRLSHQELVGRMLPCENSGMTGVPTSCNVLPDNHGTHVAAAVAGIGAGALDSNGFRRGQGVAPGAKLVAQDYDPFLQLGGTGGMVADGMLTIYRESALSGAVLTNNSWGPTSSPQGYDIPTRQMDMVTRDALEDVPGQQPVLPVWSIMNGNGDRNVGTCRPASLGSPDEAKNLFAVGSTKMQTGASQTSAMFDISSNSAHGDACDGRRVPHIVAPGCSTDSATAGSNTAYGTMCGTSMASPVVSGAVALFIEKYRDLYDGATPSPALVKAAFTAVARDLHGQRNADNGVMGHRPDRFQGYGRLDLDAVINPSESVLYFDQEHVFRASGQHWEQQVVADDPTRPVRIMLAWTDAPGAGLGGTTPAWVNNLDLSVAVEAVGYLGNVIGGDGWSAADGLADPRNNLEGVFLGPHQHGDAMSIRVDATNLAGDALHPWGAGRPAQDFALACYNCRIPESFELTIAQERLDLCAGGESQVGIQVATDTGISAPVELMLPDAPAGVGVLFDPAVLPLLPASSELVIDADMAVEAGVHPLLVRAESGSLMRTADLLLVLDNAIPAAPVLLYPDVDADDVPPLPMLEWQPVTGARRYLVEVAADAMFEDMLSSEIVDVAHWQIPQPLAYATRYYWRVTAQSACGAETSSIAVFDTAEESFDLFADGFE